MGKDKILLAGSSGIKSEIKFNSLNLIAAN